MSNMVVQTNVFALNAHRNMKTVGAVTKEASGRLASGYRINSAADDAAGLAVSEKMRAQIRGLDQASRNAQDGQALIMTADGGLQEITNMIQRMRELVVQAKNDTYTKEDREYIQEEISQLIEEIDAMKERVEYNGKVLLNSDYTSFFFQIGANEGNSMTATISAISASILSISAISVGQTQGSAITGLTALDNALKTVATQRAKLGAYMNRLEYTYRSLDISSENLQDSESRIRNTDMAKEMMNFTKANVLQQAAVSMLAQANQLPQNLLQLLR